VPVGIGLLEVHEVSAPILEETVKVEHVDLRPSLLEGYALRDHRRTEKIGQPNTGRAGAEEQVLFISELLPFDLGGVDHAGQHDAGGALHVVVVNAVFVSIALQQMNCIDAGPVLEMYTALWIEFLDCCDELIHEGIELLGLRARLAHTKVQRVVQVLLIVGARIEIHGQQILRGHTGTGRVQL
jgi:hypothetical protein